MQILLIFRSRWDKISVFHSHGEIQTDLSDEYNFYTRNIIMLLILYIWSWIYIGPNRALAKRKESQVSKETSKEKLVESTFFLFRFFSLFSLFSEVWTVAAISFWHWKSSCGSAAVWLSFVVISKKISRPRIKKIRLSLSISSTTELKIRFCRMFSDSNDCPKFH